MRDSAGTLRSSSRSRLLVWAIAAAFAAYTEQRTADYGPAGDDAAMAGIESAWEEPGGLAIALCEDTFRSAATGPDGCVVDHVVRGGWLGRAHSEEHGGGCGMGGCPYGAVAYVQGTVSAPGLGADLPVSGTVSLLSWLDDDHPYGHPWSLRVRCDEGVLCEVRGEIAADGSVAATLVIGPSGPGQAETDHALARVGAAACR